MRPGAGFLARFLLGVLGAVLLLAGPAAAHVRSESNSVWEVNGTGVDLVLTIPDLEANRLTRGSAPVTDDVLKAYLLKTIYPIADGKRCRLVPPVETLAAQTGFRKFDFTFTCSATKPLQVHSGAFFDLVATHTNFAQIQNAATGEFTEQLITNEHQTVDVTDASGGPLQEASFFEFIKMGMEHIFTGVDHMSFLLGLVLISRRLKDLVFVVTGFTIGHSLTLALAVTGILRPHPEFIDALVALTIALIGAENISVHTKKPEVVALAMGGGLGIMMLLKAFGIGIMPTMLLFGAGLFSASYLMVSGHVKDAGRLRMVITLVFGLIHGFGFASNLLEMQLPPKRLGELLVGFNVGVEIAQLTLVVGVSLIVIGLSKLKLTLPRPIVVEVCASLLVGIGVYWFVGRSFF